SCEINEIGAITRWDRHDLNGRLMVVRTSSPNATRISNRVPLAIPERPPIISPAFQRWGRTPEGLSPEGRPIARTVRRPSGTWYNRTSFPACWAIHVHPYGMNRIIQVLGRGHPRYNRCAYQFQSALTETSGLAFVGESVYNPQSPLGIKRPGSVLDDYSRTRLNDEI